MKQAICPSNKSRSQFCKLEEFQLKVKPSPDEKMDTKQASLSWEPSWKGREKEKININSGNSDLPLVIYILYNCR